MRRPAAGSPWPSTSPWLEAGILHQDERVELIDGEIIVMSPMGNPHRQSVNWLGHLLSLALGRRAMVQVQVDHQFWMIRQRPRSRTSP